MQVVALSMHEALARLAAEHGVNTGADELSRELIASVMRAQLARMFPCHPNALLKATWHALSGLTQDRDALRNVAADVLEDLQTCGDIVELPRVTIAEDGERSQWLFPALPGFILRGGRAYVFGIAPDNAPFLPGEHWRRLQTNGAARFLDLGEGDTSIGKSLVAFGLRQLEDKEWLGLEWNETAAQHVEQLRERLRHHGTDGHLPGMKVLSHQGPARLSYQLRWTADSAASGLHIARLEQPHGAPLWYLVDLSSGRCLRSLLLPDPLHRGRACDQAWLAQLAIDASQGLPANYSIRRESERAVLNFDFPIPLASRRRLLLLGGSSARGDNPYVFVIPLNEEQCERRYLEECLWLRETVT